MQRSLAAPHLRALFAALAALATVLALKALIWPRWPSATPLDRQTIGARLRAGGFGADPVPSLPARRSYERATSEAVGFALGNGQTLRLMQGRVRERLDLQLATLSAAHPALSLKERRLSGVPPAALGRNGGGWIRQTCLVDGPAGSGGFGVSRDQLTTLVDGLPSDRWKRLQVLLGTRLPRDYSCVLISVSSGAGGAAIEESRWQQLLTALRPGLANGPLEP